MHEASIALSILETVVAQCRREGYSVIESVRVRIGKGAGILPAALSFAFDAAKRNTPAREAELIIEQVELGGSCRGCGREFGGAGQRFVFNCPACGSVDLTVDRGHEMQIVDMEVD